MKQPAIILIFSLLISLMPNSTHAQGHPMLTLTKAGVQDIRQSKEDASLFMVVLAATQDEVDKEIELGIHVPVPKDMAGGYTHERHKKNFFILQKAGNLYQITGDEKYAIYIRDMLLEYAELFPTLSLHPTNRSYATGKIFWQCLNDANWLVYSSQAYDCIYEWLSPENRKTLEQNLFRPLADFLSVENPQFFNRIHNHSTWANAAVGMIGLVMDDKELIKRALYGLENDGLDTNLQDNDGGFIKQDGQQKAGFLAQLDFSFSPDGYFTEGPYYLRYAMTPFLLFSKALSNAQPDLNIFSYRDSILQKAVFSLLNQTDAQGRFFPINDAQKGMSWNAREVIAAVDIAYLDFGNDPSLLSIVKLQNTVTLDEAGFTVSRDLDQGIASPLAQQSIHYRDGAAGDMGGVAIIRKPSLNVEDELCVLMKFSAQGMGHGHFDKLAYSLYDKTGEVIQDYASARWVNIDQKGGGRYLPENQSWAKQSIAHNTLVIDQESHYEGSVKLGEEHAPFLHFFDIKNENIQAVSAKEGNAYPGSMMHRSLFLVRDEAFEHPLLIDLFRVNSDSNHQYDLPLWFQGHLLSTNFEYEIAGNQLETLGEAAGYQHLWQEAVGKPTSNNAQIAWFSKNKFYSMTSLVSNDDELIFGRIGANDPSFNLRHDPCFIVRKKEADQALFVSIIEPHGSYSTVTETPLNPFGSIDSIQLIHDSDEYTIIEFSDKEGKSWTLMVANKDASTDAKHQIGTDVNSYKWQGPYNLKVKH